jgi:HK97 gp10 family phage protein
MALVWHGDRISAKLQQEIKEKLLEAMLVLEAEIKGLMKKGGRTASGFLTEGEKPGKVGSFASKPGEPPRVQFDRLRGGITHEPLTTATMVLPVGRVGTNVEYGKYLELGTKNMAPRPFMRPGIKKAKPKIAAIFGRPIHEL